MKLIRFDLGSKLDDLRKKMKAPLVQCEFNSNWNNFDPFDFRKTLNEKGEVDVPFSKITIDQNHILSLFGKRILAYIRDQRQGEMNKFHISNCSTLVQHQNSNMYGKFVASINTDGIFVINELKNGIVVNKNIKAELEVCKHCLNKLNYKNYRSNKDSVFKEFDLKEFFKVHNKQDIKKPKYTNVNAPVNRYTDDFSEISKKVRKQRNYTCENCEKDLKESPKYLHVHHINAIKSDNRLTNLKVLCIECHAKEPQHGHMINSPDYKKYTNNKQGKLF